MDSCQLVQEIEHESADPRAVLHGRVDAVGKRRPRLRAAGGASAIVCTMFGDDERLRLGQIEHLPGAVADARVRIEARAAPRAGRRVMIDDVIGISDLPQGLAFVTFLPARLLGRTFPQARHPRGFFSPSLDGGLPLFELFNPSWRSSSAIRAFRDSFSALSAAISAIRSSVDGTLGVSRIIRFLNRKPPTQSRKIYR